MGRKQVVEVSGSVVPARTAQPVAVALTTAPKQTVAPKQPDPAKVKRDVVATVRGTRSCGHEDTFNVLAGEDPGYAVRRREKWDSKHCATCQAAKQAAEVVDAKARRKARHNAPKTPAINFRLPDGSRFEVSYAAQDADRGTWAGTLTVPANGSGESLTFKGSGEGVHGLLRALGRAWFASTAAGASK